MIKTSKELVAACLDVVNNHKTLYVMGCFGAPMNEKNKTRYLNAHAFNRKEPHATYIKNASADTFGFDCVCFIKGLFWGWNGDPNQVYGGAQYKSNGVPDIGTDQMIKVCTEVSDDFSNIVPGELVWQPGHVGIYVGNGLAAEATFEPVSKVQLQAVLPMGWKDGYPATGWTKHGKLPWITYVEETEEPAKPEVVEDFYKVILEEIEKDEVDQLTKQAKENGWAIRVEKIESKPAVTPEPEPEPEPAPVPAPVAPWVPAEGDIVYFNGGVHYRNANATDGGSSAPAGQAKISKIAAGKKHPYSLVKTGKTGPYGWVDEGTFTKV